MDVVLSFSSRSKTSKVRSEELENKPSKQIGNEAQSKEKNGKKYFAYKGHIGIDAQSKIIRTQTFTPANVRGSVEMENVLSCDEQSIWADKMYPGQKDKKAARAMGIYYGVLDKAARHNPLSNKQQKRNHFGA